jgi:N6-adenosine-specific RNA methylase IME4
MCVIVQVAAAPGGPSSLPPPARAPLCHAAASAPLAQGGSLFYSGSFPSARRLPVKFGTIIADPPWSYNRVSGNKKLRGFVSQSGMDKYATMPMEQLIKLPVSDVADKNCVLLLWTTPAFSAEGKDRELFSAWGFRPTTYTYWIKKTKTGKLWYGVGHWFRGVVEPVLVGPRIGGLAVRTAERGAFQSVPDGHSKKPYNLHEIAERYFPEPRLELFARRQRAGWTCVGNEVTGRDIVEDLTILAGIP